MPNLVSCLVFVSGSILVTVKMALLKFFRPVGSTLNCGLLTSEDQSMKEKDETPKKRRGSYSKFSPKG